MEEPIFSTHITQKLYNEKGVLIATFLGGPLAGAYLVSQNFKALNERERMRKTWLVAAVALVVAIGTGFVPALDKIPAIVYSFVFCMAAYSLTKKYQGSSIAAHQAEGGPLYTTGRAALIGLLGCAIMVAVILGLFYLADQRV